MPGCSMLDKCCNQGLKVIMGRMITVLQSSREVQKCRSAASRFATFCRVSSVRRFAFADLRALPLCVSSEGGLPSRNFR